jgi:hypothetical protein
MSRMAGTSKSSSGSSAGQSEGPSGAGIGLGGAQWCAYPSAVMIDLHRYKRSSVAVTLKRCSSSEPSRLRCCIFKPITMATTFPAAWPTRAGASFLCPATWPR